MSIIGLDTFTDTLPADEVAYLTIHRTLGDREVFLSRWDWPEETDTAPEDAETWLTGALLDAAQGQGGRFRVRAMAIKGTTTLGSRRVFVEADADTVREILGQDLPDELGEAENKFALLLLRELAAHQALLLEMGREMNEERTKLHRESMNEALAMSREFRARLAESDKTLRSLHTAVFRMKEQQAHERLATVLRKADELEAVARQTGEEGSDDIWAEGLSRFDEWFPVVASKFTGMPPEVLALAKNQELVSRLAHPKVQAVLSDPQRLDTLLTMLDQL